MDTAGQPGATRCHTFAYCRDMHICSEGLEYGHAGARSCVPTAVTSSLSVVLTCCSPRPGVPRGGARPDAPGDAHVHGAAAGDACKNRRQSCCVPVVSVLPPCASLYGHAFLVYKGTKGTLLVGLLTGESGLPGGPHPAGHTARQPVGEGAAGKVCRQGRRLQQRPDPWCVCKAASAASTRRQRIGRPWESTVYSCAKVSLPSNLVLRRQRPPHVCRGKGAAGCAHRRKRRLCVGQRGPPATPAAGGPGIVLEHHVSTDRAPSSDRSLCCCLLRGSFSRVRLLSRV